MGGGFCFCSFSFILWYFSEFCFSCSTKAKNFKATSSSFFTLNFKNIQNWGLIFSTNSFTWGILWFSYLKMGLHFVTIFSYRQGIFAHCVVMLLISLLLLYTNDFFLEVFTQGGTTTQNSKYLGEF